MDKMHTGRERRQELTFIAAYKDTGSKYRMLTGPTKHRSRTKQSEGSLVLFQKYITLSRVRHNKIKQVTLQSSAKFKILSWSFTTSVDPYN